MMCLVDGKELESTCMITATIRRVAGRVERSQPNLGFHFGDLQQYEPHLGGQVHLHHQSGSVIDFYVEYRYVLLCGKCSRKAQCAK